MQTKSQKSCLKSISASLEPLSTGTGHVGSLALGILPLRGGGPAKQDRTSPKCERNAEGEAPLWSPVGTG